MSSIVDINNFISLTNRFGVCLFCSWCRTSVSFLASPDAVDSSITLAISGHETIHLCSVAGFSGKPTVPPSSYTAALFSSRPWSIGIAENALPVFNTENSPFEIRSYTSGWFACDDTMSRMCTGMYISHNVCDRGKIATVQYLTSHLHEDENLIS